VSAGHVHAKASVILAIGFGLGGIATLNPGSVEYVLGSLASIMLSPDLDVDAKNISSTIMRKRFGWVAEKAWDSLWYWYRRSLKHGSPLSHFPVVGTLGRLVYMYLFLIVVPVLILKFLFPSHVDLIYELTWWVKIALIRYKFVIAVMAGDLIHWALDIATTEHKENR